MKKYIYLWILLPAVLLPTQLFSQANTINGKVIDAQDNAPLPSAHVYIKDTYRGTITNADGLFTLQVQSFPVTIVARFLGYQTKEITINEPTSEQITIEMQPSLLEMEEIVVTGEDPAISIMREVIRRKQIWRANLETYQAEAYTRQQIRTDTSIVSISESVSEVFWDDELGHREVLKSKRQTANLDSEANFAGVSYMPNFYDDNLDIAGFDVVGVTHPDALSYYDFKLEEIQALDDQQVFKINVSSKRKLQPLFEGTIYVLDIEYALLSVDLKPNSVVVFPPPVTDFNLSYQQQFNNYGGDYWLPVDMRIDGLVEVGIIGLRFPAIGFRQVSKLNDYRVNEDLPDSLYRNRNLFSIDSTTIDKVDSVFTVGVETIPLTYEEQMAYATIDSNTTFEKAFKPRGFLARFIDFDDDSDDSDRARSTSDNSNNSGNSGSSAGSQSTRTQNQPTVFQKMRSYLSVDARYNRVDAFYGELEYSDSFGKGRFRPSAYAGYSIGYEAFSYGAKVRWYPMKKSRRVLLYGGYDLETRASYSSGLYGQLFSSTYSILGFDDYFNYYRKEGVHAGVAVRSRSFLKRQNINLIYNLEEHQNLDFQTSYDIVGRANTQRANPPIQEGTLSALSLVLSSGEGKEAFGAVEADDFRFEIEQSLSAIGSDWDYTRFSIDVFRRYETFYKRRFFPNTLDLRFSAGAYLGDQPVQKNGIVDVAMGYFTPFGVLKSKRYIPYRGSHYVSLIAEHNFKSVPFEAMGWRKAPQTGLSLIVFGGVAGFGISDEHRNFYQNNLGYLPVKGDHWHYEAGISISNILSVFRIDLAYRIDDPGFYPGIGIARFF